MAHGGARKGAGRKPGIATPKTREIAEAALADGLTPLEFMLGVLRDEEKPFADRYAAAKDSAPYIHPRLSSVEAKVEADIEAHVAGIEWQVVDPQAADA